VALKVQCTAHHSIAVVMMTTCCSIIWLYVTWFCGGCCCCWCISWVMVLSRLLWRSPELSCTSAGLPGSTADWGQTLVSTGV